MPVSFVLIALAATPAAAGQVGPNGGVAAGQAAPGTLLIDRNRVDRAQLSAPPAPPATPMPPPKIALTTSGAPIAGIRFIGAQAPAKVAAAAQPFLGRPIDRPTLNKLAAALSAAYQGGPIALYTIAIPAQSFAKGVVIVHIVEGRIARAQVRTDRPKAYRLLRARLGALTRETPLSRATFERQLILARAIPGTTVTTDFADPQGNGALVLTTTPKQRRSKLSAGFSNRGVELLGDGQFDLRGDFYGIGKGGDQLTLAASAASDFKRFRYASAGYAAPIGADGLTASANASYLETRPKGYPITGEAKQGGIALAYPLVRRFKQSVDVSVGIDGLNSDNAAFGNVIASERTRALRLAGSAVDARTKRQVALSGALSRGLDIFGAHTTAPFSETGFTKVSGGASVTQAVGKRVVLRGSTNGQYSDDRLPAAERFAIGGATIGRAFDTAFLTGDRGLGALGEVAWRPLKQSRFATSELYGFIDGGKVTVNARAPSPRATFSLASTGIGVRARYREKAEIGLEAARVIDDPYPGYREDWRFSIAWRVSN